MENQSNYFNKTIEETANLLNTSLQNGLTTEEAGNRLNQYGYNEFQKKEGKSLFDKFVAQFKSFMIIVLLVAAVVSGVVGFIHGEGITDAIIILGIVVLNAVIGVVQEAKAEQSLAALEKMSAPNCKVIRNGEVSVIASRELVPGDLVVLDTGDLVPADLRLTEAINLKIQEASLTGESVPEDKFTDAIVETEVPLGDRENLVFSSCLVTYGRGKGVVVGTGMTTEVGKIAAMIQAVPESMTPLQIKLDKLGKFLGIGALAICVLLFITGIAYGKSVLDMFMTAVSLAAAAIPEGLPAVSTIVLAVGVQRLVKKKDGKLAPATWAEAFAAVKAGFAGRKVAALAGDLASTEAILALKMLTQTLGGTMECRLDGAALPEGNRSGYAGTARIADLDEAALAGGEGVLNGLAGNGGVGHRRRGIKTKPS